MLKSLYLTNGFIDVPAYEPRKDLKSDNFAVRIYDKRTTDINPGFRIINVIHSSDLTADIRCQREAHAALNQFHQFFIIPYFMDVNAIDADSDHLKTELIQYFLPRRDRGDFRGSDKGKITAVKIQQDPRAAML